MTVNIVLLVCSFLIIIGYVTIVFYFTDQYRKVDVPYLDSTNNVISNNEITEVIFKMKNHLKINEYDVVYLSDQKYTNFGRGINYKKKEINIKRLPLSSVGFELDYLISRLWFVSKMKNKQKRIVLPFTIITNYLMMIIPIIMLIILVLQIITFGYGMGFNEGHNITNSGMKNLWDYPIWFIILAVLGLTIIFLMFLLKFEKENMELEYNKDILNYLDTNFKDLSHDFKLARGYSQNVKIGYNFAINSKQEDRLMKWIGPFMNY